MANSEHLKILRKGTKSWNRWRNENPNIIPDLSDSDLSGLKLNGVNFYNSNLFGVNFSWAQLNDANFSKAVLEKAYLSVANLSNANLSFAQISVAKLWRANLFNTNFSHSILEGVDFSKANLSKANLTKVLMNKSNCKETNLNKANLSRTQCIEADLSGANLNDAKLIGSNLSGANLVEASLVGANLSYTNLSNTIFSNARLGTTILGDTYIKEVVGLDTCIHWCYSVLDDKTLIKCDKLPLNFLRGCGLSNKVIDYYQNNWKVPQRLNYCLIYYSDKDEEFVKYLNNDLQNEGIRTWLDAKGVIVDKNLKDKFKILQNNFDKIIIVISKNSIKNKWTEEKINQLLKHEKKEQRKVLIPIRIDNNDIELITKLNSLIKQNRRVVDFSNWNNQKIYQKVFKRFVKHLT